MPSKDALRELQLRLANRLQAARERPREAGWLAVECAQLGLLLPLAQAGEIHAARQVAPVPHAKPWMVGVANLRGQLNAVVDLSQFLHLRDMATQAAPRSGAQLVMLNPSLRVNAAILVDRLAGLRDSEQLERLPASDEPRPGFAGPSWRDPQGRVWQELDLAALAQDPQFLDVAA
ncbi:chemotaxis protein CheW [Ideonella sp. DXS29W]|uniref:Chemotaxis protein CheW n=1 Tax=Ideonella lacteola TaxID=2984193 RepID=A0ABU9BS18_9BURK